MFRAAIAVATAAAMAMTAPPARAEHGLVGRWHLDTTQPTGSDSGSYTTPDDSGNGLTADGFGVPTFPGRFGRGFDFGSANPVTQSVTVPNNPALEPASVTVAAWVKHNGFPGEKQYIVEKGATDFSASSYALYTGYSAPTGHFGLQFYTWNGTKGATTTPIADNTIWDGKWHAVAGTFDGTAAHLYVDGHEVGTGTPALGPITYGLPTSSRLRFGGYDGNCSLPYTGGLDEVRIYNRALSAAEIARLQNPAATTPPEVDTTTPPPPGGFKVTLSSQKPLTAGKAGLLVPTPTTGVKIKHYVWDLNGDGKTDADCAGSTPELAPEYPGLYTGLVKVTAITTGGLRTSTVLPVKVGAGTPAPRASALRALGRGPLASRATEGQRELSPLHVQADPTLPPHRHHPERRAHGEMLEHDGRGRRPQRHRLFSPREAGGRAAPRAGAACGRGCALRREAHRSAGSAEAPCPQREPRLRRAGAPAHARRAERGQRRGADQRDRLRPGRVRPHRPAGRAVRDRRGRMLDRLL